jgi:hypothetical protein
MAEKRSAPHTERKIAQQPAAFSPAAPAAPAAPSAMKDQPKAEQVVEEKKSEFETFEEEKEDESEDENTISDADFEEIMSILRKSKNRSSSVKK